MNSPLGRPETTSTLSRRGRWLALFAVNAGLAIRFFVPDVQCTAQDRHPGALVEFVRQKTNEAYPGHGKRPVLALLIRLMNFGCLPCLHNFFDFCDSLQKSSEKYGNRNVLLMVARDERTEHEQMRVVRGWAKSSGLRFPVILVPQRLLDDDGIEFSTALLLSADDEVEFMKEFPLEKGSAAELLEMLFPRKQ